MHIERSVFFPPNKSLYIFDPLVVLYDFVYMIRNLGGRWTPNLRPS